MRKLLKNFTKKDWALVVLAVIFVVVSVWMELTMPEYMSEITMLVQTSGSEMSDILIAGGKMLLFALGSLVSAVVVSICAARISSGFAASHRQRPLSVRDYR